MGHSSTHSVFEAELKRAKETGISEGGRDMMRIIISLIEGKLSGEKACIDRCLVKDVEHHMGRSSAFSELIGILQRDLNMLEHKP